MISKILLFLLIIAPQAKAFETSYVDFDLPPNWACTQHGFEWVCRSTDSIRAKEALLIVRAKLANPNETLMRIFEFLSRPKPFTEPDGTSSMSKVYWSVEQEFQGNTWIRALHLNGTLKNYFTEYYVSIIGDLAVALEFSYHQSQMDNYKNSFNDILKTVKIKDNIATQNPRWLGPGPTDPSQNLPQEISTASVPSTGSPLGQQLFIVVAMGSLIAFAIYYLSKR